MEIAAEDSCINLLASNRPQPRDGDTGMSPFTKLLELVLDWQSGTEGLAAEALYAAMRAEETLFSDLPGAAHFFSAAETSSFSQVSRRRSAPRRRCRCPSVPPLGTPGSVPPPPAPPFRCRHHLRLRARCHHRARCRRLRYPARCRHLPPGEAARRPRRCRRRTCPRRCRRLVPRPSRRRFSRRRRCRRLTLRHRFHPPRSLRHHSRLRSLRRACLPSPNRTPDKRSPSSRSEVTSPARSRAESSQTSRSAASPRGLPSRGRALQTLRRRRGHVAGGFSARGVGRRRHQRVTAGRDSSPGGLCRRADVAEEDWNAKLFCSERDATADSISLWRVNPAAFEVGLETARRKRRLPLLDPATEQHPAPEHGHLGQDAALDLAAARSPAAAALRRARASRQPVRPARARSPLWS